MPSVHPLLSSTSEHREPKLHSCVRLACNLRGRVVASHNNGLNTVSRIILFSSGYHSLAFHHFFWRWQVLRLFDATVSPTICYAAGTWAPNKEHERMIQSTQRKMLRLIFQTKRKYKKIEKQDIEPKEENGQVDITEMCSTDDESGDGQSTKTQDDLDSEVTLMRKWIRLRLKRKNGSIT